MTTRSVVIRPATHQDVSAILFMVRELCTMHEHWDPVRYDFRPDISEKYERWLPIRADDPHSAFFVAADPDILGFIVGEVLDEIPIYKTTRFGFIHDMYVLPQARSRGIGKALVFAAIEKFESLGVRQIRLDTATANESARRLFESCGFWGAVVQMTRGSKEN